jgi:Tfp pilus assembly protein PilZ
MNSNLENRNKTRFEHESAVTLENSQIGVQRDARMYNYSDTGLYIESDYQLKPGTDIQIGITNSPYATVSGQYERYRGVVKWRKPLKRSSFFYGYGIEFIEESDEGNHLDYGSREKMRIEYFIPVKFESENQTYEGTTENVSSGGVFIRTPHPISVGKLVKIDIPLQKKGKIKRLTGKVTRSNRQGFGVKFIRTE